MLFPLSPARERGPGGEGAPADIGRARPTFRSYRLPTHIIAPDHPGCRADQRKPSPGAAADRSSEGRSLPTRDHGNRGWSCDLVGALADGGP